MSAAGIEKARIRTETVNKYVGAEIRKRRAALVMTHGDLAARVGMSKPSVSLIEVAPPEPVRNAPHRLRRGTHWQTRATCFPLRRFPVPSLRFRTAVRRIG